MIFSIINNASAQCIGGINSFPYNENFEAANNGNWISNPSNAWQCGTPSSTKQVLNTPGGGLKSWIIGGLSGSSYASGNAELVSPCFDFTSLSNPEISFKVFWETERRFDGATFQYSIDGGISWITLGSINSGNTCLGVNWFTYDPIDYLGGLPGWSGNIQSSGGGGGNCLYGLGSGTWVTAKHNMSMLGGINNVSFRFYFGAGTQCNDFDGFAIDDIHIAEAPPPGIADFTHSCLGLNGMVQFTNNSSACSLQWDFGDPASGGNNISTQENPVHIFSTPGQQYTVTLTAFFGSGPVTKMITIYTIGATQHIIDFNKCNGESNNSFELVNPRGGPTGIYSYSWNTNPVQTTAVVSNLPGGDYTVTISAVNACSISSVFLAQDPTVLNVTATASPEKCGSGNGSITSTVTGGVEPYQYLWSTAPAQTTSSINGLGPGNYSLTVTDNYGCVKNISDLIVQAIVVRANVFLGRDTTICPGQKLVLNPGSFMNYNWQDNSTAATFTVTQSGIYSVQVIDADGCSGSDSIQVTVDCKGIFFPNAFTPNDDDINPNFGPVGDLASLKNFSLVIYDRYGQKIFTSSDPFSKWNGTNKDGTGFNPGTFVWVAIYTQKGLTQQVKKGTITIIR